MYCKLRYQLVATLLFILPLSGQSFATAPAAQAADEDAVQNPAPPLALPQVALAPARTSRLPQLSDLTQVKLVMLDGERQLVMMLDSFRTEKQAGMVTKFREEVHTRIVLDAQGQNVEQVFTVTIPYSEAGEVELKIPAGRKPVSKPATHFRFFNLNGEELSVEQASSKLSSLQAAFVLDRFAGELPELPELFREAINEKCLVIVCEGGVREDYAQPLFEVLPARQDLPKAIER